MEKRESENVLQGIVETALDYKVPCLRPDTLVLVFVVLIPVSLLWNWTGTYLAGCLIRVRRQRRTWYLVNS